MMKAICSPETPILTRATLRSITEDGIRQLTYGFAKIRGGKGRQKQDEGVIWNWRVSWSTEVNRRWRMSEYRSEQKMAHVSWSTEVNRRWLMSEYRSEQKIAHVSWSTEVNRKWRMSEYRSRQKMAHVSWSTEVNRRAADDGRIFMRIP
jgi:hypothetical protein